jgi:geranylgeranyl diphosphate synthase type I
MEFKSQLSILKTKIDREIAKGFDLAIGETKKKDIFIADALEWAKKITLAGGKRIRPALVYYGALANGQRDEKKVIRVAAAIELVHTFLLIHDDIIDNGEFRHGIKTINSHYEAIGKKLFALKDPKAFGNSMAVIVGDKVYALALRMICESGFESEKIQRAVSMLQSIVATTIVGQSQDILIECKKKVVEQEVISMYENKTAKYSFEGPLQLGLILGEGENKYLKKIFTKISLPLGIAFQIQDDIIGIFGNKKETGKSASSDIEEGKQTLLVVKAKEFASRSQLASLKEILGKQDLANSEIKKFLEIIKETGSLAYATGMIDEYFAKANKEINKSSLSEEVKEFLLGMISYLQQRQL